MALSARWRSWEAATTSSPTPIRGPGLAAAAERKPSVVLISLRQSTSHGLSLAKALRKKLGTQPMIVVYGRPTRSQRRALSKYGAGGAREAWGVGSAAGRGAHARAPG